MCVAGMNLVHALGMKQRDLVKVSTGVSAANNGNLTLLGGMFLTLSSDSCSTSQLVYVAQEATCLFLSKAACRDLELVVGWVGGARLLGWVGVAGQTRIAF